VLTISGERTSQHQGPTGGYYRFERSSGSFRRAVRLPEGIDADAIEANFDRGVLEISVPKPEQVKPHKVAITVGSPAPALASSDAPADAPESTEPAAA
jgi:HSP20 family protein